MAYVAALPDATPSPADFEYYLGILKEKERRRAALNLSVRLSEMAYDDSIDPCALVHDARSYFDQVLSNGAEPGWLDILNGATVTASELQRMEIAPRECLLEPFFKVGDFGILFSQRGVGKTWCSRAVNLRYFRPCSNALALSSRASSSKSASMAGRMRS